MICHSKARQQDLPIHETSDKSANAQSQGDWDRAVNKAAWVSLCAKLEVAAPPPLFSLLVFCQMFSTRCLSFLGRKPLLHLPYLNQFWQSRRTLSMMRILSVEIPTSVNPRSAKSPMLVRSLSNISLLRPKVERCQSLSRIRSGNSLLLTNMLTSRISMSLLTLIIALRMRQRTSGTHSHYWRGTPSALGALFLWKLNGCDCMMSGSVVFFISTHIGTLHCTGWSDLRNRYSVSDDPSSWGPVNPQINLYLPSNIQIPEIPDA